MSTETNSSDRATKTETSPPATNASPTSSPDSKASWTPKDWVTIIFSTASLILASAGFYFGNLRLDERLVIHVADVSPVRSSDTAEGKTGTVAEGNEAFEISLVLINTGNRPINLFEVWYNVAYKGDINEGGQGAPVVVEPQEIPASLPPGDCRVVRLRIPSDYLEDLYADGAPIKDDPDGRSLTWQLQFIWFDSSGRHDQVSDFVGTMRVIQSGATHLDWPEIYAEDGREKPIVLRAARPTEIKSRGEIIAVGAQK